MYRIGKRFRFEAAHSLPRLPDGHKCKRLHGHSYQVEVILAKDRLNEFDFVMDYAELDWLKELIDRQLDHRDLNEVLDNYYGNGEVPTTAENLAGFFYDVVAKHLYKTLGSERGRIKITTIVKETENTFAEYSND